MLGFIINTMSSTCSCSVSVKGDPRSFSGTRGKFSAPLASPPCPKVQAADVGKHILSGISMGISSVADTEMEAKPITDQLEKIQEMNASLNSQFMNCRFQFTNCKIQQTQDFLMKQIELSKTLQKVTDETQNALIAKNMALTNYAIATGVLVLMYVMAIPAPAASFK